MKSSKFMRKNNNKKNKTHKNRKNKTVGKKWVTAIEAAQETLSKTGSIVAARKSLRKQALTNARKLFGSIGNV